MVSAREKRIYLTRHAQGEHNVQGDYDIHDAPLTTVGRQQCQKLHEDTKDTFQKTADLLVTSGLRRTLSTAIASYPDLRKKVEDQGQQVVVLPQLQECNPFPCDKGSDREVLEADPEYAGLDLSLLTPDWNKKKGFYAYDVRSLQNRAKWVRQWLRDRPEKDIVVVSHGDCLRYITKDFLWSNYWANAEVKVFTFSDDDDEEAEMVYIEQGVKEGEQAPTSSEMV